MKSHYKHVTVCIFCLCTTQFLAAQSPRLSNIKAVTEGAQQYSRPSWSPDGTKLMFTTDHNNGIYVMNLRSKVVSKIIDLPFIGYNATWDADSKSIQFQEKKESTTDNSTYYQTQRVDVDSKKILATNKIAARQMTGTSFPTKSTKPSEQSKSAETPIEAYINDELQLVVLEGEIEKIVSNDDGGYYHPVISPDNTKVAVHKGSSIYVYSLTNQGPAVPLNVGEGTASSWTPDSKSILAYMDESSDGHTIDNSELFLLSAVDGREKVQITNTENLAEMWPSLSPNGKKLAFSDELSGNIFIADFTN